MIITKYIKEKHAGDLRDILVIRSMKVGMIDTLPEHGVVAILEGNIIAAGFLRLVEGNGVALFDGFLTHPLETPENRRKALDLIGVEIEKLAKELNITQVIALTVDDNIESRAVKQGFSKINYRVLTKLIDGTK